MRKSKQRIDKNCQRKAGLRIKSFATAMLMTASSIPMWIFPELNLFSSLQLKAAADDVVYADWSEDNHVYIIGTQGDLERYSQAYYSHSENHTKDTIELSIGSGSTRYPITNFISIGKSEAPFQGVLLTNEGSITSLNLDEPLFDYVSDNVQIIEKTSDVGASGQLIFTRTENNTNAPIFANHVVHYEGNPDNADDNETTDAVGWDILLNQYQPDEQNNWNHNFAGIIGEIGNDALVSVTFTDTTNGVVSGAGDTGLICGSMSDNSQLTVMIDEKSTNTEYTVTSSDGNAGGIVGVMGNSAVLTINSQISNRISSVTAQGEGTYAGGIVGCNHGGELALDNMSENYSVSGTITGTAGAGGVFGYYCPKFDAGVASFDASKYSINTTVNGGGSIGGLFGVLENKTVVNDADTPGGTITVSSCSLTTVHNSGDMTNYGGLIGKYSAYSLDETLTIGNASVDISKDSNSTYTNYGGCIGLIDGSSYVRIDGFTLSSATNISVHTFGGVVARADSGFIDVSGITIGRVSDTSSTVANYYGGGIVGSLENGALKMSGMIDLTYALPANGNGPSYYNHGQIVGYRNHALIYADNWTFSRSEREVDNIGSWGDVIVFGGNLTKSDVLTENENHSISISTPDSTINSEEEFAKTALGLQIDYSANPIVSGTAASNASLAFEDTINLTGTGLRGLTRDNAETDSLTAEYCVYSGVVTGNGANITLDVQNIGGKPVYRHIYNGLFGITNGVDVSSLTLNGSCNVKANRGTIYIGALAARATGAFTANSITDTVTFTADGGNTIIYLGRLLGEASSSIGDITISGTNSFSGNVTSANTSDNTCLGGVIGRISHTARNVGEKNWGISGVTLSGEIKNTSQKHTQKIGGLIAEITSNYDVRYAIPKRILTLKGITASGLTVDSTLGRNSNEIANDNYPNLSGGGLLGYSWLSVETELNNVEISNSNINLSSNTANFGDTAGLVYQATGKMTVNGVSIDKIGLNAETGARSFGVLVNKGWYGDYGTYDRQTLYIDLPSGYNYSITNDNFDDVTITDFDEILTYSATYHQANTGNSNCTRGATDSAANDGTVSDIMVNGQGIVSIYSPDFQTDGSNASATYEPKTNRGKTANPYSRYYYNLSALSGSTDDTEKLVVWGAKQYAYANIKQYFNDSNFAFDATKTYPLQNYSWYPIDYSGSVAGTFKFFNHEFEESEKLNTTKWSSLTAGSEATQHFMMHNGLFHDVNGTLNVGAVTLQGNVGTTSNGSGALVCGVVSGSAEETATFDSQNGSIILDGIYIHNLSDHSDYAPLLINKSGDFSKLNIYHVSNTDFYDVNNRYNVATSLCGNAGLNSAAKNVKVEFKYIILDGRISANNPSEITKDWYNTTHSIFTKSTLLNQFTYASGSDGVYNYEYNEDWGKDADNAVKHDVTYGSELSDSTNRNQYFGEEFWYNNQNHTNGYYTQYSNGTQTGAAQSPVNFSGFLPYVYDVSRKANVSTEKKYQLKVNHATAELSGCGTYNDPYAITTGDFETVAHILSGSTTGVIILPLNNNNAEYTETELLDTKWDSYGHAKYQWDNSTSKFRQFAKSGETVTYFGTGYSQATVRKYLAGAYYRLAGDITLSSDFIGLGSVSGTTDTDKGSVFRGVIIGGGYTITNESNYPLIRTSYGSVVKDVSINVSADITKTQASKSAFTENVTCEQYGAVIGQILGGDNIIDGVTVSFATGKTITLSGNYAQLIPVGGYVGVVVNGGLYFRGMENEGNVLRGTSAIVGIPFDSEIVTDGTETNLAAEENTKWLYVNPIVGRVLNGFAVTEGDAYRPFEDETREGYDASLSVTMKNGNKQYSIADIDDSLDMLYVGNYNEIDSSVRRDGTQRKTNVEIPNAQAMFILSSVIQAQLTTKMYNTNTPKDILCLESKSSYNSDGYKTTHNAQYNEVGTNSTDDYTNALKDSGKVSVYTTVPYIIEKYTKPIKESESSRADKYGVFCLSHYRTLSDLTLTGNDDIFYLPDGFRGIGGLCLRDIQADFSEGNKQTVTMSIQKFDGAGKTIDLNMDYEYYNFNFENYYPSSNSFSNGFGLFNTLIQNYVQSAIVDPENPNFQIRDFTITGNVKSDLINHETGNHVTYSQSGSDINYVVDNRVLEVGGIIGCASNLNTGYNHYILYNKT